MNLRVYLLFIECSFQRFIKNRVGIFLLLKRMDKHDFLFFFFLAT